MLNERHCTRCDKDGHTIDNCWVDKPHLRPKNRQKITKRQNKNSSPANDIANLMTSQPTVDDSMAAGALAASALTTTTDSRWLFHTCASFHMTSNRNVFATLKPTKSKTLLDTALGTKAPVKGIRTVIPHLEGGTVEIPEVRYIPGLSCNLLSFSMLEDQGFQISMRKTSPISFQIQSPDGEMFHACRTDNGNVYEIMGWEDSTFQKPPLIHHAYACTAEQAPNIDPRGP